MFSMGNPWDTMLFHKCLRSHKIGTWRNGHSVFIGKKFSIIQEYVVYTSSVTTAWRLIHFSFLLPVLSRCFSSHHVPKIMGFPSGSDGKESVCNAEDPGLIPGSGRSPGEGNGFSILAWRIPWAKEPCGLQSGDCKDLDMISDFHFLFINKN